MKSFGWSVGWGCIRSGWIRLGFKFQVLSSLMNFLQMQWHITVVVVVLFVAVCQNLWLLLYKCQQIKDNAMSCNILYSCQFSANQYFMLLMLYIEKFQLFDAI